MLDALRNMQPVSDKIPEELVRVRDTLSKGTEPKEETVRTLLGWFNAHRRGFYVVKEVRKALENLGLDTVPDFDSVYIDASIRFVSRSAMPAVATPKGLDQAVANAELPPKPGDELVQESVKEQDPASTLGKLPSANRAPVMISPDDTVAQATTLMMLHNYSHLPVVSGKAQVKGLISWKSIGEQIALGRPPKFVRECMSEARVHEQRTSLFEAVADIIRNQCIVVCDERRQITGIVTTSDLSQHFRDLAFPFLQIGEIENFLRELIKPHFTAAELSSVSVREGDKEITSVYDLQFGDYLYLLRRSGNFERLGLPIDAHSFLKQLDRVREIRNDIMHFQPDELEGDAIATLANTLRFFHQLHIRG